MVCCELVAACVNRCISDILHYVHMVKSQFVPPVESQTAPMSKPAEEPDTLAVLLSIHNCCILVPETSWSDRVFALTTPRCLFAPSAGSKFFCDAKQLSLCECDHAPPSCCMNNNMPHDASTRLLSTLLSTRQVGIVIELNLNEKSNGTITALRRGSATTPGTAAAINRDHKQAACTSHRVHRTLHPLSSLPWMGHDLRVAKAGSTTRQIGTKRTMPYNAYNAYNA